MNKIDKSIWVEYDDVGWIEINSEKYEKYEVLDDLIIKKSIKFIIIIAIASGAYLLMHCYPANAKEITKEFFQNEFSSPELPFRVYDYRPSPIKPAIKKVINKSISEINIRIDLNDFFRQPVKKVIRTETIVSKNYEQKKSLAKGFGLGISSAVIIRGGIINPGVWAGNWIKGKASKIIKEIVLGKSDTIKKDQNKENWDEFIKSIAPSSASVKTSPWAMFLNPSFTGPIGIIGLLILYTQHRETNKKNQARYPWQEKEKSLIELAKIPMPFEQSEKRSWLKTGQQWVWWNITHPYLVLILAIIFYRKNITQLIGESDYKNVFINRFFTMIDSSMNVLQNQIKQASESMGKFQAEIFHSWIQSHNKTNDRLENTEKKMDQLTKSLMHEKEKTHTMHLAATNYFHQLNQCVKINQENTDTLESFRNYVIDKTSLEPMMSDKMKGITESFKPKTFLIADVYTNPAMPDEEGDRNTKK